jgi:hypothetical protein
MIRLSIIRTIDRLRVVFPDLDDEMWNTIDEDSEEGEKAREAYFLLGLAVLKKSLADAVLRGPFDLPLGCYEVSLASSQAHYFDLVPRLSRMLCSLSRPSYRS